jgi:hypothetical protein
MRGRREELVIVGLETKSELTLGQLRPIKPLEPDPKLWDVW